MTYTDVRHEWHVVSVVFDLCMHAVCCVACVGRCEFELMGGEVDMCAVVCLVGGALYGLIW